MKKIYLILVLLLAFKEIFSQNDTFHVQPVFKFSAKQGKWKKISSYNNVAEYTCGNINMTVGCSNGEQKYHNPEKTVNDFIGKLNGNGIKYNQSIQNRMIIFNYSSDEYDGKYFFCHSFISNDYFMAEIELKGLEREKNEIKKSIKDLSLNSYLMLPSELDKIEGFPIKVAERDSFIQLKVSSIKTQLKAKYSKNKFDKEEENEILKWATEYIDIEIKYMYSYQKLLDSEKAIITGKLPINDWLDYILLDKKNDVFEFYDKFDDRHHGETSDGIEIATSSYFKQEFASDTSASAEYLHNFIPIIRKNDTIFWAYTVIYDEKSRLEFRNKQIKEYLNESKKDNNDLLPLELELLDRFNRSNPDIETKDTVIIICFQRNKQAKWELYSTKFGIKTMEDDFYFIKDYVSEKVEIEHENSGGDFIILCNRNQTQILVGNAKVRETNFIPITFDLNKHYKKHDVIVTSFADSNFKNYSSDVSKLSDSISCTTFVSPETETIFNYDSIVKRKDLNKYADHSTLPQYIVTSQDGEEDVNSSEQTNKNIFVTTFSQNYLKAVPPFKRIYVSRLFFNEDVDKDGKTEVFRVVFSNGELLELIVLQNTLKGISRVTNPFLLNKILELKEIKMMQRISKMPENILFGKYYLKTSD